MKYQLQMATLFLTMLVSASSEGRVVSRVQVDNKPNAKIQIVPIDDAHRSSLPQSLRALDLEHEFPLGSFILVNHTSTPITAIQVRWTYTDVEGELKHREMVTDAYAVAQVNPIVDAKDLSLITTNACVRQALIPELVPGQLRGHSNEISVDSIDPGAIIHVLLDSVIFQDGGILGPDNSQYYLQIEARYNAVQKLLAEVAPARAAGEDLASLLVRIRKEAQKPRYYGFYVDLLQTSPNPEALLAQLEAQAPLPSFRHLGE